MSPGVLLSPAPCLRCLRTLYRLEAIDAALPASRAAFSSTPNRFANPPKKKGVVARPAGRQGRTLRLSKNTRASTTRPPAVGERRSLRKRVLLSNSNALEVPGLEALSKGVISSAKLQQHVGSVLSFQDDTVDALRALEAFKPTQAWSLFRRPTSLIRRETKLLANDFESVGAGREVTAVRRVLFGERGSGKSLLQLQALAMASLKGWVLVHIPEAKDLTNAHTSYHPLETGEGTVYVQPHYTAKVLDNVSKANQPILSRLQLSMQHDLPISLPPQTTLGRLAEIGARDPELAWPVWQALWRELLAPSQNKEGLKRPPVIFTLDGVDHIMRLSSYLNAQAEPIHAHELALVRDFVRLLSGKAQLTNGGIVLAATSESNRAAAHTLDLALSHNSAIQNGENPPQADPYIAQDKWVEEAMANVEVQQLSGLSKEEARGIIEYYARSGMVRSTVTDVLVSEKWTLAGGGIVGQIEKASVRARF